MALTRDMTFIMCGLYSLTATWLPKAGHIVVGFEPGALYAIHTLIAYTEVCRLVEGLELELVSTTCT